MGLSKLMAELIKSFLSCSWKRSWLLLKSSLLFSKRTFFLSGLIFTNAMAEHSFLGFLIVFIKTNSGGDNMRQDAVISTAKDCFSAFLASFLVCITHDRRSPFIMILVTHAIFIAGMLTLWGAPFLPNEVFYLALALLSVNKSGIEYMEDFADEPAVGDSEQVIDDEKKPNITTVGDWEQIMDDEKIPNITPIDAWWEIGWNVGAITGLVLTLNFSSKEMPMISASAGAIGCIIFHSYRKRCKESLGHHQECKQKLNHEIRALLKLFPELLPLWTPFLIYYVVDAAGSTFFMEQGKALYYWEAQFYMVQKIGGFIVSNLIKSAITKFSSKRNQPEWVTTVTKITCGMFICFLTCLLSWHIEASRLQSIKNSQDPKIIIYFVIYLQFILLGTMNKMVGEMLGKLFCDHADKSMHHLEFTFNGIVEGMGGLLAVACIFVFRNWIGDTIDKSHLDKYYRALTFVSLCACVIFVLLSYTCYWKKETEDHDSLIKKMEEGGLTSEPQSFSLHSSPQWSSHFSADESIFTSSEHSLRSTLQSSAYFSADECSSLQSSAYFSADEYHFSSSGNSLQSSPQSSAYLSSDESIYASSEQTSLLSNLSTTRPSANSKWLKSLTFPNRFPPAKEIFIDYHRSPSSLKNLRRRPSAKAISHSEGPSEIN